MVNQGVELGFKRPQPSASQLRPALVHIAAKLLLDGVSTLHDFYEALGQFNSYQYALEKKMPERSLFLAVPDDTFEEFFKEDFIAELLARYQVKMIVYRIDEARIEQWIK